MPATFQQVFAITQSTELRMRAQVALTRQVPIIRAESGAGFSDEKKAKRQAFAIAVAANVEQFVTPFVRLVATNETLQNACTFDGTGINTVATTTGITDGNLTNVLEVGGDADPNLGFINVLAGVLPSENT